MSADPKPGPGEYRQPTRPEIVAIRDPVFADLIAAAGPIRISRRTDSHFAGLVEPIVYQQLAGAAARAIHGRLVAALDSEVEPEALLPLSGRDAPRGRPVRQQGSLAARPRHHGARRFGRPLAAWPIPPTGRGSRCPPLDRSRPRTVDAQMFLIFRLRRLDVWPVADFGVRQGYGLAWKVPMPTARQLEPLGDPPPPLPHDGRLVLLARRRAPRRRHRKRAHPRAHRDEQAPRFCGQRAASCARR